MKSLMIRFIKNRKNICDIVIMTPFLITLKTEYFTPEVGAIY